MGHQDSKRAFAELPDDAVVTLEWREHVSYRTTLTAGELRAEDIDPDAESTTTLEEWLADRTETDFMAVNEREVTDWHEGEGDSNA
jgi:hypothetical protein